MAGIWSHMQVEELECKKTKFPNSPPPTHVPFFSGNKLKGPESSTVPIPDKFMTLLPPKCVLYIRFNLVGRVLKHLSGSFSISILHVYRSPRHKILGPNLYVDLIISKDMNNRRETFSWWNFMSLLSAVMFGHFKFQKWACRVYDRSFLLTKQELPFINPLPSVLEKERITWRRYNNEISSADLIAENLVSLSPCTSLRRV